MMAFFLIGCGSADTSFGASNTLELDGAVDARAVMGAGGASSGGSAGSRASGGVVNTGGAPGSGGFDTTCGPRRECGYPDPGKLVECVTDADCCRGMRCIGAPPARYCGPIDMCVSDDECPCGWKCEPRDGSGQPCVFR